MAELILLDKPYGWTAMQAVRWVRRRWRVRKVGHAGTLDPLATGLLLIATEVYTRRIETLMDMEKVYYALIRLGYQTPSDDAEFPPVHIAEPPVLSMEAWGSLLKSYVGLQWQRPPAYSALKLKGKRAYALVRAGMTVDIPPRPVQAYSLRVIRYEPPERLLLEVRCGRGFYVRSLARDIGEALGCGGYLAALRRTQIGPYQVKDAIQPDACLAG